MVIRNPAASVRLYRGTVVWLRKPETLFVAGVYLNHPINRFALQKNNARSAFNDVYRPGTPLIRSTLTPAFCGFNPREFREKNGNKLRWANIITNALSGVLVLVSLSPYVRGPVSLAAIKNPVHHVWSSAIHPSVSKTPTEATPKETNPEIAAANLIIIADKPTYSTSHVKDEAPVFQLRTSNDEISYTQYDISKMDVEFVHQNVSTFLDSVEPKICALSDDAAICSDVFAQLRGWVNTPRNKSQLDKLNDPDFIRLVKEFSDGHNVDYNLENLCSFLVDRLHDKGGVYAKLSPEDLQAKKDNLYSGIQKWAKTPDARKQTATISFVFKDHKLRTYILSGIGILFAAILFIGPSEVLEFLLKWFGDGAEPPHYTPSGKSPGAGP